MLHYHLPPPFATFETSSLSQTFCSRSFFPSYRLCSGNESTTSESGTRAKQFSRLRGFSSAPSYWSRIGRQLKSDIKVNIVEHIAQTWENPDNHQQTSKLLTTTLCECKRERGNWIKVVSRQPFCRRQKSSPPCNLLCSCCSATSENCFSNQMTFDKQLAELLKRNDADEVDGRVEELFVMNWSVALLLCNLKSLDEMKKN